MRRKGAVMTKLPIVLFAAMTCGFSPATHAAPQPCEQLVQLALPNTTITSAQIIAAGTFSPPQAASPWLTGNPSLYKQLPAFCRVTAEDKPTPDSDIKLEVWMPATGWNGKFRGQGNGGFAGEIDYTSLALAVSQGYASGGTDTGHEGSGTDASWALGHPEKVIDYGYRGVHEMTQKSKSIVEAYYKSAP